MISKLWEYLKINALYVRKTVVNVDKAFVHRTESALLKK